MCNVFMYGDPVCSHLKFIYFNCYIVNLVIKKKKNQESCRFLMVILYNHSTIECAMH